MGAGVMEYFEGEITLKLKNKYLDLSKDPKASIRVKTPIFSKMRKTSL